MQEMQQAVAHDPQRADALAKARAFKRTWIDLAEALSKIYDLESWQQWGFQSFDQYCGKELHIRPATSAKLLGSFRFLKKEAPRVIKRSKDEPTAQLPSLQAVHFVARAKERGAADRKVMREIEQAAFDACEDAPRLSRRFKEVAFPLADTDREARLKAQLSSTARRLAGLLAEPNLPVPHHIATNLEEALGVLLDTLDAAN